MFERECVPEGLADMPPGPELAAVLAGIDRSRLNGHDLVIVIRARMRQRAYDDAELLADVAEVAYCTQGGPDAAVVRDDAPFEFAADEIRAALTLTRRAAETLLDLGVTLRERLPEVWEALGRGDIDLRRARIMVYGTDHLDEEVARRVAKEVLVEAAGLTTGQIAARLRRSCVDVDPDDAQRRYETAVEERR